jgi:hypothetical protein
LFANDRARFEAADIELAGGHSRLCPPACLSVSERPAIGLGHDLVEPVARREVGHPVGTCQAGSWRGQSDGAPRTCVIG